MHKKITLKWNKKNLIANTFFITCIKVVRDLIIAISRHDIKYMVYGIYWTENPSKMVRKINSKYLKFHSVKMYKRNHTQISF